MSKFAVGERVDNAADDHESGMVVAIFPTVDDNFRYVVDMEGYGALQFFAEERLVTTPSASVQRRLAGRRGKCRGYMTCMKKAAGGTSSGPPGSKMVRK